MIPENFIAEWRNYAPWQDNAQIEQDLILERAIIEIFSNSLLAENLVFRGGTALHKLYMPTQERYSEDLDFVQKNATPIGPVLTEIRNTLDPWLGKPKWKQTEGRVTLYYRYTSEIVPTRNMKVKIEINTREHYSFLPYALLAFSVNNRWWEGQTQVHTYAIEELLGTKLRALYQRKKGRDLFDFYCALKHFPKINCQKIVDCCNFYLAKTENIITYKDFHNNMLQKLNDSVFQQDIWPLIKNGQNYDPSRSYQQLHDSIIVLLDGYNPK